MKDDQNQLNEHNNEKPAPGKQLTEYRMDSGKFPIVGIGASAGGISALEDFFNNMPPDAGVAFVIIMHLDPNNRDMLPEILQRATPMPVIQVTDGMRVEPDRVYVIPPNKEIAIMNGTLLLTEPVKKRGVRMAIDHFLESLAKDQRGNAICIILSGLGSDGTIGLKMVMENFGMVIVQDPNTAEFTSMPESAIKPEFVDYILPPAKMPRHLLNYIRFSGKPAHQRTFRRYQTHAGFTKDLLPDPVANRPRFFALQTQHGFPAHRAAHEQPPDTAAEPVFALPAGKPDGSRDPFQRIAHWRNQVFPRF